MLHRSHDSDDRRVPTLETRPGAPGRIAAVMLIMSLMAEVGHVQAAYVANLYVMNEGSSETLRVVTFSAASYSPADIANATVTVSDPIDLNGQLPVSARPDLDRNYKDIHVLSDGSLFLESWGAADNTTGFTAGRGSYWTSSGQFTSEFSNVDGAAALADGHLVIHPNFSNSVEIYANGSTSPLRTLNLRNASDTADVFSSTDQNRGLWTLAPHGGGGFYINHYSGTALHTYNTVAGNEGGDLVADVTVDPAGGGQRLSSFGNTGLAYVGGNNVRWTFADIGTEYTLAGTTGVLSTTNYRPEDVTALGPDYTLVLFRAAVSGNGQIGIVANVDLGTANLSSVLASYDLGYAVPISSRIAGSVPEPSALSVLLMSGLAGVARLRHRRCSRAQMPTPHMSDTEWAGI